MHLLRGHAGQMACAENLRALLKDSELSGENIPGKVQDAYSIRCIPQIHGASRDAICYVYDAVSREIFDRAGDLSYWHRWKTTDMLIWDNWRVLHGRTAYTGHRHLCGAYVNREDYESRLRLAGTAGA